MVLSTLYMLAGLILIVFLWHRYSSYPHFTYGDTEAQRSYVAQGHPTSTGKGDLSPCTALLLEPNNTVFSELLDILLRVVLEFALNRVAPPTGLDPVRPPYHPQR